MRYYKQYYVYIITNKYNTALYVGMTNDVSRRITEHKEKQVPSHAQRYNLDKLVYYEVGFDPMSVIEREKQIKRWSHKKKRSLITSMNPKWKDLSNEL